MSIKYTLVRIKQILCRLSKYDKYKLGQNSLAKISTSALTPPPPNAYTPEISSHCCLL